MKQKMKMKRQGQTELPRFIVGALATAGASAANGATVQMTFANNVISSSTGSTLSTVNPWDWSGDMTGDGVPDVRWTYFSPGGGRAGAFMSRDVGGVLNVYADARERLGSQYWARVRLNATSNVVLYGSNVSVQLRALAPFTFSDERINGGLVTSGYLDVEGFASNDGLSAYLKFHRIIFDDTNTTAPTVDSEVTYQAWSAVPEPSSLGLLALGAGGLLARRRRSQSMAA